MMDVHEEKVLLSSDRYGRIAIVRRYDGLFCLYRHWLWPPKTQRSFGVGSVQDRRWSTDYDPALYDDIEPLPGIYGTIEDAEREAVSLLEREPNQECAGLTVSERLIASGLMQAFEAASRTRDRESMIGILSEVAVEDAPTTVDAILADPTRFGY
ncbi:MAG: hypothetical protein JF628_12925 [Sphingomonas sp.]|nr:hypothetical protein [Sphingomonas sp.]